MRPLPSNKKSDRSEYADLARESRGNYPELHAKTIDDLETFVDVNGEYVQVDTLLSFCRRAGMSESTNRQVYYEFELLANEGVLPEPMRIGNRKFWTTSFLEPVVTTMANDLYARTATRQSSGKVHDIVSALIQKPELIDAIAELLEEAKAR